MINVGLIDKTARATVKTTKGVAIASSTLVKRSASTTLNMAVNYTPDIYDEHQDLSKGGAMFAIGNSVMVARNLVRMERSAHSFAVSSESKLKARKIKKKKKAITSTKEQLEKYKDTIENIKSVQERGNTAIQSNGVTQKYLEHQKRITSNKIVDLTKQKERLDNKYKRLVKKQKKLSSKGFKPLRSFKHTISNQSRRISSMITAKDDLGTKSIGMSIKGVWAGVKFKRAAVPIVQGFIASVSALMSGIVTFVTSIPVIVTTLISFLPFILVILVIISVLSPIVATSYTGRIGTLYEKINELNEIYEVNIQPAHVLAITDELDWTTQSEEQFEQLFSCMLDQKKGNKLTFYQMASNVFIKYNPVNKYGDGVYDADMKTGISYWSLEGFDINFVISNSVKRNLLYSEHIELYPTYKRAGAELKKKMKTAEYQAKQIKEAKNRIASNQQRYEDYIYEQNIGKVDIEVTGDNEKGLMIAKKALTKLGCWYIWGAGHNTEYKDPALKEFDCSGLVNWAFYQTGINIGDQTTSTLIKMGQSVTKKNLQAGDLLLFDTGGEGVSHVGIYVGEGKMVHAPTIGDKVKIAEINTNYWNKRLVDCRRLY